MDKGKGSPVPPTITPGCSCSRCRKLKEIQESGAPAPTEQMSRVQRFAAEQGWSDFSEDNPKEGKHYLRPNERADREEREATGKTLRATYYYLLGPIPNCRFGDRQAAKLYLLRIEAAIDHGGWTRSEAMRLRKMRAKWKARAEGNDPRFNEVGNRQGGLHPQEASMVRHRKLVAGMKAILEQSGRSNGD